MILLDPGARPVIGHRGARAQAPENTVQSLLEAVKVGAEAVEFDLRVTRDGVLVLMHDPTLDRTTDCHGPVEARTLAELRTADAGARFTQDGSTFPWRARGVGIPTFDEAVDALPHDLPMIIEVKTAVAAQHVRRAISRRTLEGRVIVAGFDAASTRSLREAGFALGACMGDVARLFVPSLLGWTIPNPSFSAMCIPTAYRGLPLPIGSMVRSMTPHGVVTHIWTVNDRSTALRLWYHGVNGIISDDPQLILAVRDELP